MKSLWNEEEAKGYGNDALDLRVYTSQLLGREPYLVMHGGGNTSVKDTQTNLFGESEEVLFVKGSGWDLATIERKGFAPVKMDVLLKMAELDDLSDEDMVKNQRAAMTNPSAPNPSVEAILHAIIPFKYVDHTHADSVVTITNTKKGEERIKEIYGDRVLIIPYIMPGFILAREIYKMTKDLDWNKIEGLILLNHGVFSFSNEPQESYENMIKLVTESEEYIKAQGKKEKFRQGEKKENLLVLAQIRQEVSKVRGAAVLAQLDSNAEHVNFSEQKDVKSISARGPITPDHVIRTKRVPVVIDNDPLASIEKFSNDYKKYFKNHANGHVTALDSAPRWAVWPGHGTICFGRSVKENTIISDITTHTIEAITTAESLDEWTTLSEKDLFEMEYWVLEQAKLKKSGFSLEFQGKIALVTGAASGIGRAVVDALVFKGAVVAALDIDSKIESLFDSPNVLGIVADVTDEASVHSAVEMTVRNFGGLDILVSNAGTFPPSERIEELKKETWAKSMDVNLTSHELLMRMSIPYLSFGINPSIIIVASKNVSAPGPGVSAYSVAKAGLTQLARVAALELSEKGVRVNVVHPNAVFDTAIWTKEVLEKRAKNYGLSVDEYKKNNLLKTEVTSKDVATLITTMAGEVFSKTTGAQVPIDGGNDRVI